MRLRFVALICLLALGLFNLSGCGCTAKNSEDQTPGATASGEHGKENGKVQDPVFVLASGTYEGEQQIVIDAAKGDTVYYTLDGSEPGPGDTTYQGPFTLQPGRYTVRAMAVNPAGQKSKDSKAQYDIKSIRESDPEPEVPALSDSIQGLWGYHDQEYNNVLLYEFQGDTLKVGYLQSEWQGPYVFEVVEESTAGGLLRIRNIDMDCRIDYGTPGDNKISLVRITPEETFPEVTLLYLNASGDILNDPDAPDAIRKKIAAMDNSV